MALPQNTDYSHQFSEKNEFRICGFQTPHKVQWLHGNGQSFGLSDIISFIEMIEMPRVIEIAVSWDNGYQRSTIINVVKDMQHEYCFFDIEKETSKLTNENSESKNSNDINNNENSNNNNNGKNEKNAKNEKNKEKDTNTNTKTNEKSNERGDRNNNDNNNEDDDSKVVSVYDETMTRFDYIPVINSPVSNRNSNNHGNHNTSGNHTGNRNKGHHNNNDSRDSDDLSDDLTNTPDSLKNDYFMDGNNNNNNNTNSNEQSNNMSNKGNGTNLTDICKTENEIRINSAMWQNKNIISKMHEPLSFEEFICILCNVYNNKYLSIKLQCSDVLSLEHCVKTILKYHSFIQLSSMSNIWLHGVFLQQFPLHKNASSSSSSSSSYALHSGNSLMNPSGITGASSSHSGLLTTTSSSSSSASSSSSSNTEYTGGLRPLNWEDFLYYAAMLEGCTISLSWESTKVPYRPGTLKLCLANVLSELTTMPVHSGTHRSAYKTKQEKLLSNTLSNDVIIHYPMQYIYDTYYIINDILLGDTYFPYVAFNFYNIYAMYHNFDWALYFKLQSNHNHQTALIKQQLQQNNQINNNNNHNIESNSNNTTTTTTSAIRKRSQSAEYDFTTQSQKYGGIENDMIQRSNTNEPVSLASHKNMNQQLHQQQQQQMMKNVTINPNDGGVIDITQSLPMGAKPTSPSQHSLMFARTNELNGINSSDLLDESQIVTKSDLNWLSAHIHQLFSFVSVKRTRLKAGYNDSFKKTLGKHFVCEWSGKLSWDPHPPSQSNTRNGPKNSGNTNSASSSSHATVHVKSKTRARMDDVANGATGSGTGGRGRRASNNNHNNNSNAHHRRSKSTKRPHASGKGATASSSSSSNTNNYHTSHSAHSSHGHGHGHSHLVQPGIDWTLWQLCRLNSVSYSSKKIQSCVFNNNIGLAPKGSGWLISTREMKPPYVLKGRFFSNRKEGILSIYIRCSSIEYPISGHELPAFGVLISIGNEKLRIQSHRFDQMTDESKEIGTCQDNGYNFRIIDRGVMFPIRVAAEITGKDGRGSNWPLTLRANVPYPKDSTKWMYHISFINNTNDWLLIDRLHMYESNK